MLADFFTKPLVSSLFKTMRDVCQGIIPIKGLSKQHTFKELKENSKVRSQIYKECVQIKNNNNKVDKNEILRSKEETTKNGKFVNTQTNGIEENYENIKTHNVTHNTKNTMIGNKLKTNTKNPTNKQNKNKQAHRQTMSNQKSDDFNKNLSNCEERNYTNLREKVKKVKDTYANVVRKQLQTRRNKRKDLTETIDVRKYSFCEKLSD